MLHQCVRLFVASAADAQHLPSAADGALDCCCPDSSVHVPKAHLLLSAGWQPCEVMLFKARKGPKPSSGSCSHLLSSVRSPRLFGPLLAGLAAVHAPAGHIACR
jgi:hypothetical protein